MGFPGETPDEFNETLDFCHEMSFARIHVFPYSSRPGTAAAAMPGQITAPVKRQRAESMLALAQESAGAYQARFLDRIMPVLWEQVEAGIWSGYTPNYMRIFTRSERDLTNHVADTILQKIYRGGIWGELIDHKENP